jgi:hypothetical protein
MRIVSIVFICAGDEVLQLLAYCATLLPILAQPADGRSLP